jgi:CBS domain-containing protein
MDLLKSLERPVSEYMYTDFVAVPFDTTVEEAAGIMMKAASTEAVVTKGENPVGILTERDILYKVVAAGKAPSGVKVQDVMTSPLQTIEETAKAGDAIAKMSTLGIRRLCVTKSGRVVGLVTQKSMVSGKLETQVVLPELTAPEQISCPYCGEVLENRKALSKHIDDRHIGRGLLQGNVGRW